MTGPAPILGAEAVHVWRGWIGADAPRGTLDVSHLPLDAAERSRMGRYLRPIDAIRFALARAFLRNTLSPYVGIDPAELRFETGIHGKPRLSSFGEPEVHFNLTHSGDWALLAVSSSQPIGVDIEATAGVRGLDFLIDRCLSPDEAAEVSCNLGPESERAERRRESFLRFWTRKEALLKGLGVGLGTEMARVSVSDPARPVIYDGLGLPSEGCCGWVLHDLRPTDGYVGAVAVKGKHVRVQNYDGEPS